MAPLQTPKVSSGRAGPPTIADQVNDDLAVLNLRVECGQKVAKSLRKIFLNDHGESGAHAAQGAGQHIPIGSKPAWVLGAGFVELVGDGREKHGDGRRRLAAAHVY